MSKAKNQTKVGQQPTEADKPEVELENSPGKQLVRARDALGLTQEQVADRLHLRLGSVQAVEQDVLEDGVSATFNKGYVRLYARLVHLDSEPLLVAYDQIHKQDNQPAKMQSFSKRVSREAHDHRWNMVTIVVVLLVIGSVIGWWVQQSDSFDDSQKIVSDTIDSIFSESDNQQIVNNQEQDGLGIDKSDVDSFNTAPEIFEDTVPEIEVNNNALAQDVSEEELQDDFALRSSSDADDIVSLDDTAEVPNEDVSNETSSILSDVNDTVEESSDQTKDFAATAGSFIDPDSDITVNEDGTVNMAFTFKEDCWVSVKDLNDEIIAIGVKAKGRVMEVSGQPPIQLILCAPQNVDIVFGNSDVDMSIYPRNRTVNFTLLIENN